MVNYEKEGDLEIHLADGGGYHQRYPDEFGSVELPGVRWGNEQEEGGCVCYFWHDLLLEFWKSRNDPLHRGWNFFISTIIVSVESSPCPLGYRFLSGVSAGAWRLPNKASLLRTCYLMKAGLTNPEIEHVMNVPHQTVWYRVNKIREVAGDLLEDSPQEQTQT